MKTRILVSVIAAAVIAAATSAIVLAQAKPAMTMVAPAVKIEQCFVTPPKPLSHVATGTQIVYVNVGHRVLHQVTFAVGYRNAASHFLRSVQDQGTFDPGVQIDHHFNLYNDVTYAGKAVASCHAITAK